MLAVKSCTILQHGWPGVVQDVRLTLGVFVFLIKIQSVDAACVAGDHLTVML